MHAAMETNTFYQKKWLVMALHAIILLAIFAYLPARTSLANGGALLLSSDPLETEIVYTGDIIHYTVSIGRDGEALDWTWLRVTFGEGISYVENSLLLDCAKAVPADLLPVGETPATPQPISREVIHGNNGFVLLSSALLNGDSLSFDVMVGEHATPTLSVQAGEAAESLAHTLGAHAASDASAPEYVYMPPEPADPPTAPSAWKWIAVVLTVAILGGVGWLLLRKRLPRWEKDANAAVNPRRDAAHSSQRAMTADVTNVAATAGATAPAAQLRKGTPVPQLAHDANESSPHGRMHVGQMAKLPQAGERKALLSRTMEQAPQEMPYSSQLRPPPAYTPGVPHEPEVTAEEVRRMAEDYKRILERHQQRMGREEGE